jgi:ubiquinone/menaquinone biosynthesis C-methylase UbiE
MMRDWDATTYDRVADPQAEWGREVLERLDLEGDETVLDVGCGRGLLLIGAARRLTTGKAVGVDIWQAEDLSGNRPEATLENARLEGVAERVEVKDGDARRLPFADGTFDVIVTKEVLHNIYNAAERDTAVREIARVLRPGGRLVVVDAEHPGHPGQPGHFGAGSLGVGEIAGLMEAAGFACSEVSRARLLPFLRFGRVGIVVGRRRPASVP